MEPDFVDAPAPLRDTTADTHTQPELNTPKHHVQISIQKNAFVSWHDGQNKPFELHGVFLELCYDALATTAFLKLRAQVIVKSTGILKPDAGYKPAGVAQDLFIMVPPERIQALSLIDPIDTTKPEIKKLGIGTVGLRVALSQEPALVVPQLPLACKTPKSGLKWDALQLLAQAISFNVYFCPSSREVPRTQLQSLCETVANCQLSTMPGQADVASLYAGKGGQWIEGSALARELENPPSYAQAGPGPPMPPVLQGHGSNKRRRVEFDADVTNQPDTNPSTALGKIEDNIARVEGRYDWLEAVLQKMDSTLTRIEIRSNRVEDRGNRVEDRVDRLEDRIDRMRDRIDRLGDVVDSNTAMQLDKVRKLEEQAQKAEVSNQRLRNKCSVLETEVEALKVKMQEWETRFSVEA